jgi:hypothetical protein
MILSIIFIIIFFVNNKNNTYKKNENDIIEYNNYSNPIYYENYWNGVYKEMTNFTIKCFGLLLCIFIDLSFLILYI